MKDQVIAVTGAAGALGSRLCGRLAEAGAQVAAIDRASFANAAVFALPNVDLGDERSVADAFAAIAQRFDRLDGLVNVAGGFIWEKIEVGGVETWDKLYAMNVRTALIACRAALPLLLKQGGAIVNIGANAAQRADEGMGAYAASKAGVSRLTESLAAEFKDRGVRANAVMPSIIDTPANRAAMPEADFTRWVAPDALADVISFLLSDQSRAITGALIPVTGRV